MNERQTKVLREYIVHSTCERYNRNGTISHPSILIHFPKWKSFAECYHSTQSHNVCLDVAKAFVCHCSSSKCLVFAACIYIYIYMCMFMCLYISYHNIIRIGWAQQVKLEMKRSMLPKHWIVLLQYSLWIISMFVVTI